MFASSFFASRFALAAAAITLLLSLPARAAESPADDTIDENVQVQVGPHVVCDTQKQMERFVTLYDGNVEITREAVNNEEKNPNACSIGVVAYVQGPEVARARGSSGAYHIVRILVLGVATEAGMQASVPTPFFAVTPIEEVDA